jgi:PP-loop superfamily ATP-utilizing enzyme
MITLDADAALVLFSGGQDSTTCLAWALDAISGSSPSVFSMGSATPDWSYGCGARDACRLGARGWAKFAQGLAEPRTSVVR